MAVTRWRLATGINSGQHPVLTLCSPDASAREVPDLDPSHLYERALNSHPLGASFIHLLGLQPMVTSLWLIMHDPLHWQHSMANGWHICTDIFTFFYKMYDLTYYYVISIYDRYVFSCRWRNLHRGLWEYPNFILSFCSKECQFYKTAIICTVTVLMHDSRSWALQSGFISWIFVSTTAMEQNWNWNWDWMTQIAILQAAVIILKSLVM